MRVFSALVVLGVVSASDFGEPIVSLEKITSLVKSTADLGIDSVKFVSVKFEEALSDAHRPYYTKFTDHVSEYKVLVIKHYKKSFLKPLVDTVISAVFGTVLNVYETLNNLNHKYLDSLIEEFEYRFPSSSGLLGQELIDRALTFAWLFLSIKWVLNFVFCRRCCKASRKL